MTRLLLASDFDGTVAGIRSAPQEVVIDPAAAALFKSAGDNPDITVAIISGRDLDDLKRRTGGVAAWLSGAHGLEVALPDGSVLRPSKPWRGSLPGRLRAKAEKLGFFLEEKRYGVALHWRGAADVDAGHPVVEEFAGWAAEQGLDAIPGRMVLEARMPGGRKLGALTFVAERTGAARVVYAGDDLTDLPALRWAATRGRGLFVRSREHAGPLAGGIESVGSTAELLEVFREEVGRLLTVDSR